MIAPLISPGIIEFCLPDRKTILLEEFIPVTEENLHLLVEGVQYISSQIRDGNNLLPILHTFKSYGNVNPTDLKSNLATVAYDTCLIFKDSTNTY